MADKIGFNKNGKFVGPAVGHFTQDGKKLGGFDKIGKEVGTENNYNKNGEYIGN